MKKSWSRSLREKHQSRSAAFPAATIAFYGSDNSHASKVAVGIRNRESEDVTIIERWFEHGVDVRVDPRVGREITEFLTRYAVRHVVVADRIIGCPHEQGVDYPENEDCPECPWWHGRDRWTGQPLSQSSDDRTTPNA